MEKDQSFVEMVVKEIVDNPDKVTTERTVDERGVLITLTVAPEDMGKLIGKEGRTAKAIRTLLRVLGAKNNARVNLKIAEPEGGTGGKPRAVLVEDDGTAPTASGVGAPTASVGGQPATVEEPLAAQVAQPTEQPAHSTSDEGMGTELI